MSSATIIANGFVITCDPRNRAGRLSLLLRNGRIQEIAQTADAFLTLYPDARIVDASQKLIVPGFVNAHMHGESVLLRDRTAGRHAGLWPRDARLRAVAEQLRAPESLDDLRMVYLTAFFTHLQCGTVLVGEFPPDVQEKGLVTILQAVERSEIRAVTALQNWDQIRQARELGARRPPFMVSLGREEEYTVYSFEQRLRAAAELGVPPLVHAAETREDEDTVRKNFQKGLISVLRDFGALRSETLLVHCNHIAEEDLPLIREAGSSVVLCPRSAMMKGTGYPALRALLAGRKHPCLGTDWGSADMVAEMQFLHQLPQMVPTLPRIGPVEILRMATVNGAEALGMAAETGSIETGKRADLAFFGLHTLRAPLPRDSAGVQELASLLMHALSSRDITDVMINGEFFLADRKLLTMAEEDLAAGYRTLRERAFPAALAPPSPAEQARVRTAPFAGGGEDAPGFTAGISAEETPHEPLPPPPRAPRTDAPRPATLPELPREVRRVFGDDEEL